MLDFIGIDHVVFRVADIARALDFYVGVLGCTEERRLEEFGLYQLRCGASLIDLVPLDSPLGRMGGAGPGAEGRNVDHVAFAVAELDEALLRKHLAAHGVEILEAGRRYGAGGFGPSLYIRDPDGNTVEIKGPPDLDQSA